MIVTCFKGPSALYLVFLKMSYTFYGLGLWLKNYLMGTSMDKDADQWRSMKEYDD